MEEQDGVVVETGDGPSTVPPFKMPSSEELLAAIEKMAGLSDEDREQLRDGVLRRQQGGGGFGPLPPAAQATPAGQSMTIQLFMLLSLISLVFLIIVFFGYKLYKSLVERERRREEKKRQKLQKKKK